MIVWWDQGWKSFSIDLAKRLFCLSHHPSYLLTNLYYWLHKKLKHRLQWVWHLFSGLLNGPNGPSIWTKNNNGPRIDPCGTPDSMLDHEDSWPFNTTLSFLHFKESSRIPKRLPDIPFCFNLKIKLLRYTFEKRSFGHV